MDHRTAHAGVSHVRARRVVAAVAERVNAQKVLHPDWLEILETAEKLRTTPL